MSESEAAGASAPGHPLAVPLALSAANREKADAFLDLVMEELREENPLKLSCLRARRFSGYARMALEISIGLLALVAGISLMVWNAAHSEGLVIESFSVPPDLAARGMVASQEGGAIDTVRLRWLMLLHLSFLISGCLFAVMDWVACRANVRPPRA